VDDPDEFIPFIVLKANDSLLVAEGEKLGLDKHPDVVAGVGRAYRRKTLYAFYDFITSPAAVPEAEARAFYDANTAYYRVPEGYNISKIVVGNREAADSVIMRLEAGEAFADVARARSRDPFTATQGGNVGFLKVGDDEEFDGFLATMQVGEKKVFRSLEGYVVLWLMERHSPRQASFEEARGSVEQRLIQAKKDEILEKWIAERRQAVGVTIDRQVLDQVVFPS
jgi:parvulin-like peptidyl-prolyl isomerase